MNYFFYYTGHGEFFNDEFYFQLADFDHNRRNQTSFTNSNLDDWLRSLSPQLTIKVIDACNSGIPYIKAAKDPEKVKEYFTNSGNHFQNCIFMYSSAVTQSSYCDNETSFFTQAFLDAVRTFSGEVVRYRNIIEYIADEFQQNQSSEKQQPIFITQGTYTEIFCYMNGSIGELATIDKNHIEISTDILSTSTSLKSLAENAARKIVSKEIGIQILTELKAHLESYAFGSDFNEIYDAENRFINTHEIPNGEFIGRWLSNNSNNYFAEPTYSTVYDSVIDNLRELAIPSYLRSARQVLDGFKFTTPLPFGAYEVIAEGKFSSLPDCYCVVTYLASKTKLNFYFFYSTYLEENWDNRYLDEDISWENVECNFADKDSVLTTGNRIIAGFERYVLEVVKTRLNGI